MPGLKKWRTFSEFCTKQHNGKKTGDPFRIARVKTKSIKLLGSFRRQLRVIPARNAVSHVLNIGVTQFLGRLGRLQIGAALRIAGTGDDQRVFIRRQDVGQMVLDDGKTQRVRRMTSLLGIATVGVDDDRRLGGGRCLHVFHADIT